MLVLIALGDLVVSPVLTVVTALSWLWMRFVYRIARQQWPSWHPRYALYIATVASVMFVPILAVTALLLSVLVRILKPYIQSMPVVVTWPIGVGFSLPLPITTLLIVLSLGLTWSILWWYRLSTRRVLVDTLRPDAFRSGRLPVVYDYSQRIHDRVKVLQDVQRCSNVTVYSGYSPFLGSGDELQTWGFTVDLSRGLRRPDGGLREPKPFTITKLHRHVRRRLEALRDPELPAAQRVSGLVLEDRLFVSGGAVHRDRRLLPDPTAPPVAPVSPRVVHEFMNNPTGSIRHFKCIRIDSWMREIAFSAFLHFAIHGRTLYVEQTVCMLLPIKAGYHVIDGLTRGLLPGEGGSLAWETVKDLPASPLRAPVELFGYLRSRYREQQEDRVLQKIINEPLPIDYGARVSVRELGQAGHWRNYFQELDSHRQLQLVQAQVLNAILGFLEEHHIDTSEFRQRQSTIMTGVFMQGGSIYGSSIAAGPGATAVTSIGRPGTTGAGATQSAQEGQP